MRRVFLAAVVLVLAASALAGEIPPGERRSGYEFMSRETRAMQDDDTANPATLWVLEGGTAWTRKTGAAGRSCADCHGDARASMKGVAARHPERPPLTLRGRDGPGETSQIRRAPTHFRPSIWLAMSPASQRVQSTPTAFVTSAAFEKPKSRRTTNSPSVSA